MISMQRSLSSPVRAQASPPVSPTINNHHSAESQVQPSRPRRDPSPSTGRSSEATQTLPFRRADDTPRRGHAQQQHPLTMTSSSRKPLVAQPKMPPQSSPRPDPSGSPVIPNEPPTEAASTVPKPLLQDVSDYTNPHLSPDTDSTTLEELAHLVRLSKYQERKRANTRLRLQRNLISTALSARLTRCGEIAHRNLVDSFRREDKESFAALQGAIHDVRNSCDELCRYALLDPEMESLSSSALGSSESLDTPTNSTAGPSPLRTMVPFLHDISASARDTFLDFLTQLRTNPDYLATRICALSSSELNAFVTYHKGLEPVESVLPFHGRSAPRSFASGSGRGANAADIERLLSFQRHDPLSILIHTCFANSAGPDSSEDQRRTDIWATALARLISEPRSTREHFLISVLNIWTAMRDWSGKSNMEWYLMKILEDGAFLLDRAEDQHGTRFNLSDWNQSDEVAAKEFYERAVNQLFELVDDEDATGIPEGLLELGNAILKKLDNKYVENTSRWLVWRCLFFVFLLGVIVHPESYGLLAEYHITPYAREKILKKVAMKAHEYVSSMWSGKPSATCVPMDVPSKIKGHVESILARFQGSRSKAPAAKLLPARSITSLRETKEVHPYLVISPADLVTLVNAIFPERRPQSAASGSFRSGPASISGLSAISQPISMSNPRQNFETASIISTSASSVFSDATTSRDGYMDEQASATPQRYSPPAMDSELQRRLNKFEDDGYRLRLALHEMTQNLGGEAVRGSCHPCRERWMVLFISSDGKSLSTHMTFDPDEELDDEENSSSNDTSDDDLDGPELDKDYHQLRDSVLKLVQDYEIPRSLEPETGRTQLSNRASGLKKYKSRSKIITPEKSNMASRNPYRRQRGHEAGQQSAAEGESKQDVTSPPQKAETDLQPEAVLVTMLKAATAQSKALADFVSAHEYWKTLNQLNALGSSSLRANGFAVLINIFSRGPRDSIRRSASAIEEYDAWLVWLKQSQERHEGLIDRMMKRVKAMRDKMWYVMDVRNSKEYEHSRDICQALKTMGMQRRWDSFQRSRANVARGPNSSYLYRTESQIMDLLAASEEQGGPNKLSDDQAETTSLWLQKYGIENFCQGEERIHRFCCEVDKCISKLVGETIREAPVLWSSDLYKREKVGYDRARREREHSWAGDDASSIISDQDRRFTPVAAPTSSRPNSFARDLRTLSAQSPSQQSLDSLRQGYQRTSVALSDIPDGQEYFDRASPAHTLDSSSTFWSPFQPVLSPGSGASRTTSMTNLSTTFSHHAQAASTSSYSTGRPGTAASSNETVFQARTDDEKTRFLSELKQTLTSLLLSDLGNQVFARGSETDGWFARLGQQCIDRKDALDRRAKRRSEIKEKRGSGRPRVIEKKKSFGNLRGAGDPGTSEASSESPATVLSDGTNQPTSTPRASFSKDLNTEFPFKGAYQRLLNMFCVHPNPYAKLNALHELESLIVAALGSSGHKRPRWNRSDAGSSVVEDHANNARPTPLEGTIDNVKERRSQALQSQMATPLFGHQRQTNSETRSIISGGAANTDAITKELQALFREASIRPSTLFRDLQFIASFVPASVLDKPERGKAFWNTALAALKLKSEVCRTMVEMADEVVASHTLVRKAANDSPATSEVPQSTTGTPPPPSTTYKLEDAGRMWAITAKEGFPTAQRELALFYLSNPEYVERTTLPLSKPREVFKQTVMDKYGRSERSRLGAGGASGSGHGLGSGGGGARGSAGLGGGAGDSKESDVRTDPGLMCVAVHWMEAAEHGGDELATSFLRQNEFMGLG